MPDAIDLSKAVVHSSPDVASWPATVNITKVTSTHDGGLAIEYDRDIPASWKWKSNPANPDDNFQYTVWAGVNIGGVWHVAGFVEMWQGRPQGQGSLPELLSQPFNWWADVRHLWGDMSFYQPKAFDRIALFITAGNARLVTGVTSVPERSNVVLVTLSADGNWTQDFTTVVVVPPPPLPPDGGPDLLKILTELTAKVDALSIQLNAGYQSSYDGKVLGFPFHFSSTLIPKK